MKKHFKRGISLLLVLAMLFSMTISMTISAYAAEYTYNWGTRGVTATYLSEAATAFYHNNETDYTRLSSLSGAADISSVPSSALYQQLQALMEVNHTYITSYQDTRDLYQYTDCQNGGGTISSFYSGLAIGPAWDGGATWNREHTWPNSKGLDGDDENDLMMLRPTATSGSENSARGNKAYGESSNFYHPNSVSNGTYDLRGDVARIMLYTYVRWGNTANMWGSAGVIESKEVLLKWIEEDPVDTWELGRNDSVESITGTRNVFVDYPELAFVLFDEDVPADMITPSGEAADSSYTITATVNDSACGSVSVNGKVINVTPAAGYEIESWQVVSGTATVSPGDTYLIVDASSDCTIQVNFAPKSSSGICLWENGSMVSGYSVYTGDTIILPESVSAPDDYTFLGWSTGLISDSTEYPVFLTAGSSYTITSNTNLFAVYSYTETDSSSESYVLVTAPSQLTVGSSVVIAAAGSDCALSTEQKTNNRGQAAITKNSDNTISWSAGSTVAELVLGKGAVNGTYSFYCDANNGYLYCASNSKSNYLKTQSNLNDKASFAITVNGDGTCDVVSQTTSSTRNELQYNSQSDLFACYAGTQKPISLYIKSSGGSVTYYTTGAAPECDHSGAAFATGTPATCTATGWTDGLYCGDCQSYVLGHEPVAATGHTPGDAAAESDGTKDYLVTYCEVCGEELSRVCEDGHLPGDINGDGSVNNKDATRLFQYLSDWDVYVVEEALDVNGDGSVNNKDATRLFQYLSDWDVEIYCKYNSAICRHDIVIDEAVEPTCNTTGLTEGSHCCICNTVLVAQEVRPASHDMYQHKCKICGYEDDFIGKFDVSADQDGSIYAYIYNTSVDDEYALCFYGVGSTRDYDTSGAPYYALHEKIKYVEFGEGVTRIGNCTLFSWYGWTLKGLTLPNTLVEIGNSAFERLNLYDVENGLQLPNSLVRISCESFKQAGIGNLVIPDSVLYIDEAAFCGAEINQITFGSGIKQIEYASFSEEHEGTILRSLEKTVYKNGYYVGDSNNPYFMLVGVTDIEITSLDIHPDTIMIYDRACMDCIFLKSVTIPDSVRIIGDMAFGGCISLETALLGSSVEYFNGYAFYNCSNLKSISMENSIEFIGKCNFSYCYNLEEIIYSGTIAEWGAIDFEEYWDRLELEGSWAPLTAQIICKDGLVNIL